MQWLKELKGHKKGKRCLLVGGGMSAGEYSYKKIKDVDVIALNDSLCYEDGYSLFKPDYLMYSDGVFVRVLKQLNTSGITVIGNANNPSNKTKIGFTTSMFKEMREEHNVGLKSIMVAQYLGYDEIYLIGYDFIAIDKNGVLSSHHQGDRIGKGSKYIDQSAFEKHIKRLDVFVEQFNELPEYNNVYNLNKKSKLTIYPYKGLR